MTGSQMDQTVNILLTTNIAIILTNNYNEANGKVPVLD